MVQQTYLTDAWGVPQGTQGSWSTQPFGFTGEQWDAETGFVHLRARYYMASLGRFVSRDAVFGMKQAPGTLHRYGYAGNNPVNWTDPSG